MGEPQRQSLIVEYSHAYSTLQQGKRELLEFAADRVLLNRYIVDAALDTGEPDSQALVDSCNFALLPETRTPADPTAFCRAKIARLVALQEELNTLQKLAREKGLSPGLLTVVGHAANQSPEDNGMSVIRQIESLLTDAQDQSTRATDAAPAANDQHQQMHSMIEVQVQADCQPATVAAGSGRRVFTLIVEHWRTLLFEAAVCLLLSIAAIRIVS